jgi:hypothetical protein
LRIDDENSVTYGKFVDGFKGQHPVYGKNGSTCHNQEKTVKIIKKFLIKELENGFIVNNWNRGEIKSIYDYSQVGEINGINYNDLIALLLKGFQEQETRIQTLEKQIETICKNDPKLCGA